MPKEPRPLHDLHPLRLLPLVLCLVMVVFCIIRGGFSVEDILSYAPRNVWLAAGFLLLLYLAKSLSVAFPIIVLQVAAGHLFAPSAGCWAACPACWPPPCWAPAFHSLVPRPFGSPLASPPGFPSSRCWAISFGKGVKRTKSNPAPNRIPLRRGRSFPTPCLEHPRHHCLAPALSSPDYPPWLKRKK